MPSMMNTIAFQLKGLGLPFFKAAGAPEIPRLHDTGYIFHNNTKNLIRIAQQRFGHELDQIWANDEHGVDWEYSEVINRTRAIAKGEYGDRYDKSGEPEINHAHRVGSNAYLLARLVGFNTHQAITVLCGGYLHDRIEHAKDPFDFALRYQELKDKLDFHDKDIANLVLHETRIPLETRYLIYTGNIGARVTDFEPDSTINAQIGLLLVKLVDINDNDDPKRNTYLEKYKERAAIAKEAGDLEEEHRQLAKLAEKKIRRKQYTISAELIELKIDSDIRLETTVPSFLNHHPEGQKYFDPFYSDALIDGLGPEILAVANKRRAANNNGFHAA